MKVFQNSVCLVNCDPHGACLVHVGEREQFLFEGEAEDCANFLETAIPVGLSVTVRHDRGLRSCMNKPSLWADIRNGRN